MRARIAVTGVGTLSSVSQNTDEFITALLKGKRGFSLLKDKRPEGLRATHAGLIEDLSFNNDDPPAVRILDRNVHLALAALREALSCAGLSSIPLGDRGGIVLGTCSGGMQSIEQHYKALAQGKNPINKDLLFSKKYYTTAKVLAWAAGARGPVTTVVTACAAGTGAIVQAADFIRSGMADIVLAGGADTFALSTLVGFDALKATCEGTCAPFSNPVGLNLGEGAAFLVLERMENANKRGAKILCELLGCGLSNDAYHPTAPDPSARGQLKAIEAALKDAGIDATDIDYINAHGTGTRANDPTETRAIGKLLGARAGDVPVSSTKSMIGHCLGGSGALEASACILATREGFIPPTAGFNERREGCDLDYVPDLGRRFTGRIVISNSFGFAGNNACLALDTAPSLEYPFKPRPKSQPESIVICGTGIITPAGIGVAPLKNETSHLTNIDRFPTPVTPFVAGIVPEINPKEIDRRMDLKGMDLCSKFAVMATKLALNDAKIKPRPRTMENIGLVLGIADGPGEGEAEHLKAVFENNFKLNRLGAFPYVVPNEVAGHVARSFLLKGYSTVLATGQGAGLGAIVSAATAVSLGHANTILAVASDQLTKRSVADNFKVGLCGPGTPINPAEGAAAWLLEKENSAIARGADIKARLLGYSLATDSSDPRTTDKAETLFRVIDQAIEHAGINAGQITAVSIEGPDNPMLSELKPFCLSDRIGFAEASLPLFNLTYLLDHCLEGDIILGAFISREGLACAIVIENHNSNV